MRRPTSVVALLAAVACAAPAATKSAATLDAAGEPLRSQFDAAAGKVRAILLAAPT